MRDPPPESRRYTEEEVGLILRRATEMQRSDPDRTDPAGLTLAELEDIAAEAGIDPERLRSSERRYPVHRFRAAGLACLISTVLAVPARAQGVQPADERPVEQVVRDVYDLVSWTDGNTPDWEAVRDVFIPEASVVLRYPPDLKVMSVDGFLLDWLRFENQLEEAGVSGFQETVTSAATTEFGDIAHVHVVYESRIPGADRPARPGVDLWSLIRVEGRWKVVSVVNELPRDDLPVPSFGH